METVLDNLKRGLKSLALSGAVDRIEDLGIVKEEYQNFFENLARYCFLVDRQENVSDIVILAEKEELSYSGIFSSEDLFNLFFTCKF